MSTQLMICLIIFALTIISYCVGKLSMATTAILSMMLLNLTGCIDAGTTLGYFSNSSVIMVGTMCIVAAGFNRTQFCMSMANGISRIAKGSLTKILAGYCIAAMVLAQFIQSPAVVIGIVAPMATPGVPYFMAAGGYSVAQVVKQSWIPAIFFSIISVGWIMTVFPLF